MKTQQLILATASASLLAASSAMADRNFSNASGDYQWFNPSNWQQGEIPVETDLAYVNNDSIPAAKKTSADNPAILYSATETATALKVNLGWGNNDAPWLDVRSDLQIAADSTVGRGSGTDAHLLVSGGTTSIKTSLLCGHLTDSKGTVTVDGGTLLVNRTGDWNIKLGENGSGTLEVKSGAVRTAGDVTVGNNPTAVGVVDVSGGSLFVGRNMSHWMSDATYRQSGGETIVCAQMNIGSGINNGVPSQGHLDISGGTLVVSNKLFASQNGNCDISITGGNIWVGNNGIVMGNNAASVVTGVIDGASTTITTTGEIYLSAGMGSRGTLTQKNGALTAPILNLASISNSVASYTMESGSLSISNVMRVGMGGTASFRQVDGDVYVKNQLNIGAPTNDNNCFDGTQPLCDYTMEDGTLTAGNVIRLGNNGGNGRLALLGGETEVNGWVFIGNGTKNGVHGHGELVLGGEADATFKGEVGVGATDTESHGVLHVLGGGSGTRVFKSNVYWRNDPVLKATVDAKGLNPILLDGYFQIHDLVELVPARTADAKPGKYEVLRWTKTLIQDAGCGFEFADGVDTSLWSFDFNTTDRVLYLTLKEPATLLMVR